MAYINFVKSGRLTMSSYFLLLLFIIMNSLSFVKLRTYGLILPNKTCINIPFASLSSRNDDRFIQLKLFASPQFISNYSQSCVKFDM
jgi:hypothetical protein